MSNEHIPSARKEEKQWLKDSIPEEGERSSSPLQERARNAKSPSVELSSAWKEEGSSPDITVPGSVVGSPLRLWLVMMALIVVTVMVTLMAVTQPSDEAYLDVLCRNTNSSGGAVNIEYTMYGYNVECEIPEGQWKTVQVSVLS